MTLQVNIPGVSLKPQALSATIRFRVAGLEFEAGSIAGRGAMKCILQTASFRVSGHPLLASGTVLSQLQNGGEPSHQILDPLQLLLQRHARTAVSFHGVHMTA